MNRPPGGGVLDDPARAVALRLIEERRAAGEPAIIVGLLAEEIEVDPDHDGGRVSLVALRRFLIEQRYSCRTPGAHVAPRAEVWSRPLWDTGEEEIEF